MNDMDDRARFIDGLRVLASVLEQHPEVPLPVTGEDEWNPVRLRFSPYRSADPRRDMAAAARAIPCRWAKVVTEEHPRGEYPAYFDLRGQLGALHVELTAERDVVCKKVVTGTREVTEEVPDPDALAAVPKVAVTRVVEDVEWECAPIMAALPAGQEG